MTRRQRDKPKILSVDYLVGLTDGEGCFYVNIRPSRSKQPYSTVELHFYLKLRGDHLELLNKVKESFGCGAVYHQSESRANHSECFRFEINSRRDIFNTLIPLFDKYPLQGPKQNDYLLFRQVAEIVRDKSRLTATQIAKIGKLKRKMNLGVRRVWKIRSLGGNAKKRYLSQSARQVRKAGNILSAQQGTTVGSVIRTKS